MNLTKEDIAILDKFNFDTPPISVKYLTKQPDGLERLNKLMAFCEMLKWAQGGNSFFSDVDNHTCGAGPYVLGLASAPDPFISGEYGAGLQIFDSPRAGSRLYHNVPTITSGVVKYVAFSTLEKLLYDPDVVILLANTDQTEIILRALSYKTGKMWVSKTTPAIGCAWMYVYPYLTGELNYLVTGLGHGMKRRNLFPQGKQIISIPFDLLTSMLQTLQEMPWVLPAYKPDGMEFVKQLLSKLGVAPPQ
jgi:uncharacterized protein (DUF169 family)